MTLGQYRVGGNPGNDIHVTAITNGAAQWIDYLEEQSQRDDLPAESKELIKVAQRQVEGAAMWSVKAVTKQART